MRNVSVCDLYALESNTLKCTHTVCIHNKCQRCACYITHAVDAKAQRILSLHQARWIQWQCNSLILFFFMAHLVDNKGGWLCTYLLAQDLRLSWSLGSDCQVGSQSNAFCFVVCCAGECMYDVDANVYAVPRIFQWLPLYGVYWLINKPLFLYWLADKLFHQIHNLIVEMSPWDAKACIDITLAYIPR